MPEIIRIDMIKGVEEGSTSVSPQSPKGTSLSSPSISPKGAIMIGYGVMAGKQVLNTTTQEIRAGGNEQMATALENTTKAVGIAVGAIATGGLSLIPMAISTSAQYFTREKSAQRKNRSIEYERSMRGSNLSYGMGGGYE